ncbi:MAG: MarR family transcriptional regulator [Candidatus Shapirobacteria bacterium]
MSKLIMNNIKQELFEEFFATVTKISRIAERSVNCSLEDKAATILQMQGLSYLSESPNSTVSELAQAVNMSSSSIAQFTDRLTENKLISRKPDVNDRRIVRLNLTDKGRSEIVETRKRMFHKMGKVLDLISESDLKELIRIHKKILHSLEEQEN